MTEPFRLTVAVMPEQVAEIKRLAKARHLSVSSAMRRILDAVNGNPDFFLGPVLSNSGKNNQNDYDGGQRQETDKK